MTIRVKGQLSIDVNLAHELDLGWEVLYQDNIRENTVFKSALYRSVSGIQDYKVLGLEPWYPTTMTSLEEPGRQWWLRAHYVRSIRLPSVQGNVRCI